MHVKGVAHSDEPTEHYHPRLQHTVLVFQTSTLLFCFTLTAAAAVFIKSSKNPVDTPCPAPADRLAGEPRGAFSKTAKYFHLELVETKIELKGE